VWGAFGKKPDELSPEEGYGVPVHKVTRAPDGLMYVLDRSKNRIQEFELVPGGARYLREVYVGRETWTGTGSCWNVDFTPDNKYMYVCDGSAMKVWTVDRENLEVLGWTSALDHEGDDNIGSSILPIHQIALLPNGDLLCARLRGGLQVLKYQGVR
jgi:hypothetical protein